jgi:hypothetical protein
MQIHFDENKNAEINVKMCCTKGATALSIALHEQNIRVVMLTITME